MKIIFLDIDGVLNSYDYMRSLHFNYRCLVKQGLKQYPIEKDFTEDLYGDLFDHRCVLNLENIILSTNANIVITSTWRKDLKLQGLKNMWQYRNISGKIIDITQYLNLDRGLEIKDWLDNTKYDIESFVILDDETSDIIEYFPNNTITCKAVYGISFQNVKDSIEILNKK